MEVNIVMEDDKATLAPQGKLTVQNSPDLSDAIDGLPSTVTSFDIDLSGVVYIASAGLRVLVAAEKLAVSRGGSMRLLHPCEDVMGVLEMTGLSMVFTIVQ